MTIEDLGLTRDQAWHLHDYVVDHASDHDGDCSCDDTCECKFAARNAAVSAVCRALLNHLPPMPIAERQRARREGR